MPKHRASLVAVLSILPLLGAPAQAGDNTEWLREFFARHYGSPIAGHPSIATVDEVDGRDVLTFDLSKLLRPLAAFFPVAKIGQSRFLVDRKADGTVRYISADDPSWKMTVGTEQWQYSVDGYRFEGLIDPETGLLLESSTNFDRSEVSKIAAHGGYKNEHLGYRDKTKVSPKHSNLFSLEQNTWIDNNHVMFQLPRPASDPASLPETLPLNFRLSSTQFRVAIEDVPLKALKSALVEATYRAGDAWTEADSAAYRQRVADAAPVFTVLDAEIQAKTAAIEVAGIRTDLVGLKYLINIARRADSEWNASVVLAADKFGFSGLDVPRWVVPLLPRQVDIGFGVESVDPQPLGAPFLIALQNPGTPPDPAVFDPALSAMTRSEDFRVRAGPGRVRTETLSIDFDLNVTPNAADRLVGGWVTAKGLDDLLAVLLKQTPVPAALLPALYAAKALAVPGSDGELRWDVSVDREQRVMVNGKPVGPQSK